MLALDHGGEASGHESGPHLVPGRQGDAAGHRLRVRSIEDEQIGEVRDHHPYVRHRSFLLPAFVKIGAAPTEVLGRPQILDDVEPGGRDDDVEFVVRSIGGFDTGLGEAHDVVGDEVDIVTREGSIPTVIDDGSTHHWRVIRHKTVDEVLATAGLGADVVSEERSHVLAGLGDASAGGFKLGVADEVVAMEVEQMHDRGDPAPVPVPGHGVDQPSGFGFDMLAVLVPRADPLRCAHEDVGVLGHLGHARQQLHTGGSIADDGDSLTGEVEVFGPAGRVHHRAPEGFDARKVRFLRIGEQTCRADDRIDRL
ncbi:unannotated protein [freshwater metagenome]|uniref:Unannotated protein n=1 Tax=freshwater metagenome TaxID=449393 RepID=A0A6J5Y8R8_9ZZZZ